MTTQRDSRGGEMRERVQASIAEQGQAGRAARGGREVEADVAWARWRAQPWRRQLRREEDLVRPLERRALVARLVREGLTPAAELAWLAGSLEVEHASESLTIQQVVRYADSLIERVASAGLGELVEVTYLQRNAVGLANRMIDLVNASH